MCSVLPTLMPATCEQWPHLLRNVHNCNNTHSELAADRASELAADRARDRARADTQRQEEQDRVHERLRSASRRQSAGDVGSEQQAAAADALQQQVDEYLAYFDPEKPLYQDGWAMEEMQENFQQKLRQCGTSVVSCVRSGGTRMRSARIPLSTCEFCDARGTHVQV